VATWYGGILGVGEYTWRYGVSNWLVFGVPYYLAAAGFAGHISVRSSRSQRADETLTPEQMLCQGPLIASRFASLGEPSPAACALG